VCREQLIGFANDQLAATANRAPIKTCAHRQLARTAAISNSLTMPTRKTTPYYPVWSLIYIAIAIMVIYGLSARYGEQTT